MGCPPNPHQSKSIEKGELSPHKSHIHTQRRPIPGMLKPGHAWPSMRINVPLVDIPVLNSINRQQWDVETDFTIAGRQVWLSDTGRKKWLEIYERRKQETWKHPVIGYSLTYSRLLELETRLLEKEWMNEGGLFARFRLR